MKTTGIIRRIDDLGRVVIPKEIRRTMHIHEGDPLEIYLDNGNVCFKPYTPLDNIGLANKIGDVLKNVDIPLAIYDTHKIIYEQYLGVPPFYAYQVPRGEIPGEWTGFRNVIKYDDTFSVSPIIYEGDLFGHILYRTADDPNRKIVRVLSNLICMLI